MEPEERSRRGDRRITALHMRSASFKGTARVFERPKAMTAAADKPSTEGHKPSTLSPLGGT